MQALEDKIKRQNFGHLYTLVLCNNHLYYNLISEAKDIPIFVNKICHTHLLANYFHLLFNNISSCYFIFSTHLPYPNN